MHLIMESALAAAQVYSYPSNKCTLEWLWQMNGATRRDPGVAFTTAPQPMHCEWQMLVGTSPRPSPLCRRITTFVRMGLQHRRQTHVTYAHTQWFSGLGTSLWWYAFGS